MKNTAWHSLAASVCAVWALMPSPTLAEMEKVDALMWSFAKEGDSATLSGLGLTLPPEVGGLPMTRIGDRAFRDCHWLKEIAIPDGVTAIGVEAFAGCSGLQELTLPDSTATLGTNALEGCDALRILHVPAGWTPEKWADAGIPEGCTVVVGGGGESGGGEGSGGGNEGEGEGGEGEGGGGGAPLDEFPWTYTLYDGLATVTSGPTEGDIVIPSTLGGCPVGAVGEAAFSECGGLTSVVIPDSVTRIGWFAFEYCNRLLSVTLPAALSGIGDRAFLGCDALQSFLIPPDSTNYATLDGVLFSKDMKTLRSFPPGKTGSYTVPDGVERIESFAFSGGGITDLTLPDTLTSIGDFALCVGSVSSLTVPDGVQSIGAGVFLWCSGLKKLVVPASWKDTTILSDSGGVPAGCKVVYAPSLTEKRYATWLATLDCTTADLPIDGDADSDGASNWEECVAGTNPFDPADRFEARILARDDGTMVVEPSSAESGRVYRVHGTTHLLGADGTPPVWDDLTGVPELSSGYWHYFRVGVDFAE